MRLVRLAVIGIFGALVALSQTAFEVASVKATDPNRTDSSFNFAPGGLQIEGGTFRKILEMAYNLRTFQIVGGPGWLDSDRYDIAAKNEEALQDVGREQRFSVMRERLQALLADRFQLKVHHETRELTEYTLVVAKGGHKLAEADPGADSGIKMGCGVVRGIGARIADLALILSRQVERPVLDKTALSGRFNFEIHYSPDSGCVNEHPSLFSAIQEQVGLKLESVKGPVEVIVVDRVERPTAN